MDLTTLSASALSRLIAARQVAPSEVMAAHLARIAALNEAVNAIVSAPDPEALMAQARAGRVRCPWITRPCSSCCSCSGLGMPSTCTQ